MIRASVTAGVACALGVMVSACADGGKSPYASLGEDFAKANKAASEIFQAQIADANRVRRLSEVAYYTGMRTAAHRQKIDINAENADDNFANFVCAGVGEGNKTAAALRYTADYAKALEAITKQPGDSFSGYAKALKKLRKDAPVIEPIKLEDDAFDACVRSVVIQVTPLPVASQNESAVAAWQAGAALYDALV
uniref:hypothetical protein n=1 Tax=Ferrovibrio terrae TaxID=2594003 RepID=UPI0031378893